MPGMAVSERKTATERRDEILEAALVEFAARGLDGGSTEAIARAVGIAQPYVFRLFGTKKQLFMATVDRCLQGTLELMRTASAGLKGEEVLHAIADVFAKGMLLNVVASMDLLGSDRGWAQRLIEGCSKDF